MTPNAAATWHLSGNSTIELSVAPLDEDVDPPGKKKDDGKEKKKEEEKKKPEEPPPGEEKKQQEQGPKMRAADGIPPVAQLKALRAEQLDVNQQTKEFADLHPDTSRLTPQQQHELEQIQREQNRLMELFQQMIAPAADNKGDEP